MTESKEPGRPCLEQRFSPLVTVRTTLHDDGLVVQVARPFRERIGAVDFGRLVLEPASMSGVRPGRLWLAGVLLAGGLAACLPAASALLGALAGPVGMTLLAAGGLASLAAVASPRRLTLLLDRERALNPVFLRDGDDDAQVESFLLDVRRAAIEWRCRSASGEATEEADKPAGLADSLDALHKMHADGLLSEQELRQFSELAQRRR